MPRAKANPDPAVITYQRNAEPRVTVEISARRDGSYSVTLDGKVIAAQAPQLGAYFGASLYPSNRLQDEAIATAKIRIESMLLRKG